MTISEENLGPAVMPVLGQAAVVAHRGLRTNAVENSFKAFRDLVMIADQGIPISVEFDVRATKDGTLVVNHDETFGTAVLEEVTYHQLRSMFGEDCPPTLDWVVSKLGPSQVQGINPEVKVPGYTAKVLQTVAPLGLHRLLVSSFNTSVVREIRELAPSVQNGLLCPDYLTATEAIRYVERTEELGADVFIAHRSQICAALSTEARAQGKQLGVYTVNKPALLRRLYMSGEVDWVCTDVPELLLPAIDSLVATESVA